MRQFLGIREKQRRLCRRTKGHKLIPFLFSGRVLEEGSEDVFVLQKGSFFLSHIAIEISINPGT